MAMSVRTQCTAAMRRLLDDPAQRVVTEGPEGTFTELDIIFLAAREEHWEDDEARVRWMRFAQREASEVGRWFYHEGRAVRFGPVEPPGVEHSDYVRFASKIVYAPLNGPKSIRTPNGTFRQVLHKDDSIRRPGRRQVTARDDLEPWGAIENANTEGARTITRLKAEVVALQARVRELEQDNHRLRQHVAQSGSERKTA